MHQLGCFGGRNPTRLEPLLFNTGKLQHFLENGYTFLGGIITIQVIAFAQVSATDKYSVNPPLEGKENMVR